MAFMDEHLIFRGCIPIGGVLSIFIYGRVLLVVKCKLSLVTKPFPTDFT
uniref:ToxB N-terminal domain n=1 Tax=Myoviridae sp. ctqfO1 TaxID=2827710 RepID=A0A8S5T2X8_9CAUD|nr:MAG TPA: ToxB N-terminal domain [Myoviridae sp. ctqfO1]